MIRVENVAYIGKNLLLEEFKCNGFTKGVIGGCLDSIRFKEWGYEHMKYYLPILDEEYIKSSLESCEQLYMEDIMFIKTDDEYIRSHVIEQPTVYKSEDSPKLMQQLHQIENLGIMEVAGQSNSDFVVYYYFSYMIYEVKNMSVKIPIKTVTSSGESYWSYEYLIYPNFKVNEEVLTKVQKMAKDENITLNISNVEICSKTKQRDEVYRQYSTALHNFLRSEYMMVCNEAKGIVNAIRLREHYLVTESDFYDIHQNSRISKKDSISFSGFDYQGDTGLEEELSLNQYLEMLGTSLKEITETAVDKPKFEEFLMEHRDNIMYKPVLTYMANIDNPFEAMKVYEEVEKKRSYLRKMIYQLNMCLYDNMTNFLYYLETYQPGLGYASNNLPLILLENITWERGEFREGYKKVTYQPRKSKNKVRGF